MTHRVLGKLVCFIAMSLVLVLGVSLQASAQGNVIYLNPAITDHGNKAIKYSLAFYIATAKGYPRTVVRTGPNPESNPRTPYLEYTVKKSISVPRNFTLVLQNGARLKTVGSTVYINFFCAIQAGSYQIFDTDSDIRLRGGVTEAPFEWWGAHCITEKADEIGNWPTFDSGPAIQAAVRSCSYVVGSPGAAYLVKTPIELPTQITVDGKWCTIYGNESIGSSQAIFVIKDQKNVVIQNMSIKLDGADRFLYVFGSRDVKIDNVFLREDAAQQDFTFIDIHNSYHCYLNNVTMHGGGPQSDNGSVGVLIRSDALSGGFPVVDNIGIDNTTIGSIWTCVLLDFDNASNNILLRNVSFLGMKPSNPGAYYGLRSIGSGRIDFINIDGLHMESMPRGITFEPGAVGYTMSVKCVRFSDVEQVFNLYGDTRDQVTIQTVDFRASASGQHWVFYHLDASVKKLDEWQFDSTEYSIGPKEGTGVIN